VIGELRIANRPLSIPTEKQVRNDKEARIQQYGKGSVKAIDNRLYERFGRDVELLVKARQATTRPPMSKGFPSSETEAINCTCEPGCTQRPAHRRPDKIPRWPCDLRGSITPAQRAYNEYSAEYDSNRHAARLRSARKPTRPTRPLAEGRALSTDGLVTCQWALPWPCGENGKYFGLTSCAFLFPAKVV
jgi:hypothetical protein